MIEGDRGIVAQIKAVRAKEARRDELEKRSKLQDRELAEREAVEAKQRQVQALEQSFLTLKPSVEPLLRELADEYRDENGQPLDNPQVETIEPYMSDTVFHSGHFALIWGSPKQLEDPHTSHYKKEDALLTKGKKLSPKQLRIFAKLSKKGEPKVTISGFNTIVFVAETEEDSSRKLLPVLYLQGTGIPRTRIQAWYDNTRITETSTPIAPILAIALDHPSNHDMVTTSVTEFDTGAENIRPTGPFV